MKDAEKGSRRWENPPRGPLPSIADDILAKGKDADGLLSRIAHDIQHEREEEATRPKPVWVPVQSAKPKREWLPEAEYREKMRQIGNIREGRRGRGRKSKPWQHQR